MGQIEKPKNKRIIFNVTVEEHTEIKKRAVMRNITIREYIMQAVEQRIKHEKKYE